MLNGQISPMLTAFIYDAFKAKEDIDRKCRVEVLLEGDEGTVLFSLLNSKLEVIDETEMAFLCKSPVITLSRISNTAFVTDKHVEIGQNSLNAQIIDSHIIAERLIFSSKHLLLASSRQNKCVLISKKDVLYSNCGIPQFDIRCESGIEICFPNINVFHRLRKYGTTYDEVSDNNYMKFDIFVIRILGLISKHKQYVGKKDKEYIDNKIIGKNHFKRCLMDFLIEIGIIYKMHNELRWYELDVDQLAKYGLSQITISLEKNEGVKLLYDKFMKSHNYQNYLRNEQRE